MTSVSDRGNRALKWSRRIARIWGTLVIVIVLFVLIGITSNLVKTGEADPYAAENYPPIENLPPLFMFLS